MRIFRATNREAVEFLKGKMQIIGERFSEEQMLEGVRLSLTHALSNTYLLMAFEKSELKAYVLAIADPGADWTRIASQWVSQDSMMQEIVDKMFFLVGMWSLGMGRQVLRLESVHEDDALRRRWGFHKLCSVYEYKIEDEFQDALKVEHKDLVPKKE